MPVKPRPLPSLEKLQEAFRYDPESGAIYALTSATSRVTGERCDRVRNSYRQVYLAPKLLRAHRVAWKLHCGVDPIGYIDHINGDKTDNRICNLRESSHAENCSNRPLRKDNSTGHIGVTRRSEHKWRAYVTKNGKRIWLGDFNSPELAAKAAEGARKAHHGQFAKLTNE